MDHDWTIGKTPRTDQPPPAAQSIARGLDVNKLAIQYDALVFICDGRKALFLRNAGDEKFSNLKTERVFAEEKPPTQA